MSVIGCGSSINITLRHIRNTCLAAALIAGLIWVGTLAFPTSTQGYSDESWILPQTISSGLAHACGIRGDGTAVLSGTPDPSHLGDHQVVLVVYDQNEMQDSQAFTITVDYVNQPPFFTSSAITEAKSGVTYAYDIVASDTDIVFGDTLTISAATLPDWLTFDDIGDGTATLTGIPAEADVGHHPVVLMVSDLGGLTDTQSFTITVTDKAADTLIYLPLIIR